MFIDPLLNVPPAIRTAVNVLPSDKTPPPIIAPVLEYPTECDEVQILEPIRASVIIPHIPVLEYMLNAALYVPPPV